MKPKIFTYLLIAAAIALIHHMIGSPPRTGR
jgi:hypothetical protein